MSNPKNFLWVEKYRPTTLDDCVLPTRIKDTLKQFVAKGDIPNFMFTGGPGIGKTTAAMALCDELGLNYLKINSSMERGIDVFKTKIINFASTMSFNGKSKVIILDEADGLTPESKDAFRGIVEKVSGNCKFILTCNNKSKLNDFIHSRMSVIDFNQLAAEKQEMMAQSFKRLKQILTLENVTFDPAVVAEVVKKYYPDYRKTIGEIQSLSISGKLDASILSKLNTITNISDLFGHMKNKDFLKIRKWAVDNSDLDHATIFSGLYSEIEKYMDGSSIPLAVIYIAKYQYQAAFVADQEINLVACLIELMADCTFK